jgi:thiol-disulfide isomerase/thioredoxin
MPDITFDGPRVTGIPVLPVQALMNTRTENARNFGRAVRFIGNQYPKDSLSALAVKHAQAWVDRLQATDVKGLQLDPDGRLSVMARQDALAQRQIAKRLATPGLSLADQIYTLVTAVNAFADEDLPERLPIAERYLAQLDALGVKAISGRVSARMAFINAYYRLGQSTDVARMGLEMYAHTADVPYHERLGLYGQGPAFIYGAVVDALGGQPDGRTKIKVLNEQLLAATKAPPELIAFDSSFFWKEREARDWADRWARAADRVGLPGTPILANYWINRGTSRAAQTVNVADGRIRVVEIGHFTCGPCMAAVPGLNRLHAKYPGVDFTFLTWTLGVWGNRIVDSKTECDRLADHFLNNVKASIPIGIAFTPRDSTPEGLWIPHPATQTFEEKHYPQVTKPTFYVLDGKGIIRRVMFGYDLDLEKNLGQIIEFLQREVKTTPTPMANASDVSAISANAKW